MGGTCRWEGLGEGVRCGGTTAPGDRWANGVVPPTGGAGGRACAEGAGHCHLDGGEEGCWPTNTGPSGGLGGTLLGGWAKPAARGCGTPAAGSGGNLTPPPTLTICPCPPSPFDAHGQLFSTHGRCGDLATHGCPCSYPASCRPMPAGGPAKWLEVPGPWWARAEGWCGEGGVADTPLRPRQLRPVVAIPGPMLPPPQSPLHGRGGHPVLGSVCREEVLGPLKVERSLGPEDASSLAAADAMEVVGKGGGGLLVGLGPDNGGGVGAGTCSPQGPVVRGRAGDSLVARGGAGQGGLTLGTSWAWAHGGGRHQAGAGGWYHGGRGRGWGDWLLAGPCYPILSGTTVG